MAKPIVWMRKLHKWIGLIIGIQVFLWILGGTVMSILPLDQVHGDHLHKPVKQLAITSQQRQEAGAILNTLDAPIVAYQVKSVFNRPLLVVNTESSPSLVFDLNHSKPINGMTEQEISLNAMSIYTGDGKISAVSLINERTSEYKKSLPAWQVTFDDSTATAFYFNSHTGELNSVRNRQWRVFDFFWMLHIMDYQERENFNHPLLIICALIALLLTLSGVYLLVKVFSKRDFSWLTKKR